LESEPRQYVTWTQFIATLLVLSGLWGGIMGFTLSIHSSTPHDGAVRRIEWESFQQERIRRLVSIEEKLSRIERVLMRIDGVGK
jgi:hypothetical protein